VLRDSQREERVLSMEDNNRQTLHRELGGRPAIEVWGRRAMVSSMHPQATDAGLGILRAGGNAVDAALAVASTIAVTSHNWAGLAGDSVWLIHEAANQKTHHLDGYGTCPAAMTAETLAGRFGLNLERDGPALKEEPEGIRDTGIVTSLLPGTPAAWCSAARRFGTMPLDQVFDRAILLARSGVVVTNYLAQSLANHRGKLAEFSASREIFFHSNGSPLKSGDTLVQSGLGATLQRLARNGTEEFTHGETAQAIARQARARSALLTADDLSEYQPVWREPIQGGYRGLRLVTTGAPTAGIHVLQALAIVEKFNLAEMPYHGTQALHLLIEAIKLALVDRRRYGGDPDHSPFETDALLEGDYVARQAESIDPKRATSRMGDAASPANETTHFVVVDNQGNIVSATQTIGRDFGSGEVVEGTGLLLNDRSWWMSLRAGPNAVGPHRRANIGHAPTMAFDGDRLRLALGSPGGFGIVQYVVQTVINVVDHGFNLQTAIEAPRFRVNDLETAVGFEARFDAGVIESLRSMGHQIATYPDWSDRVGGVEGIESRNGNLLGGYDPRRNSLALGY